MKTNPPKSSAPQAAAAIPDSEAPPIIATLTVVSEDPDSHPTRKWDRTHIVKRLQHMREIREFALEVALDSEQSKINEAAIQIASSQIYEIISDFDPSSLKAALATDPENYTRLINALYRLGDGGLKYERYRAEVAERKSAIAKELAAAKAQGGLSPGTIEKIERELNLF